MVTRIQLPNVKRPTEDDDLLPHNQIDIPLNDQPEEIPSAFEMGLSSSPEFAKFDQWAEQNRNDHIEAQQQAVSDPFVRLPLEQTRNVAPVRVADPREQARKILREEQHRQVRSQLGETPTVEDDTPLATAPPAAPPINQISKQVPAPQPSDPTNGMENDLYKAFDLPKDTFLSGAQAPPSKPKPIVLQQQPNSVITNVNQPGVPDTPAPLPVQFGDLNPTGYQAATDFVPNVKRDPIKLPEVYDTKPEDLDRILNYETFTFPYEKGVHIDPYKALASGQTLDNQSGLDPAEIERKILGDVGIDENLREEYKKAHGGQEPFGLFDPKGNRITTGADLIKNLSEKNYDPLTGNILIPVPREHAQKLRDFSNPSARARYDLAGTKGQDVDPYRALNDSRTLADQARGDRVATPGEDSFVDVSVTPEEAFGDYLSNPLVSRDDSSFKVSDQGLPMPDNNLDRNGNPYDPTTEASIGAIESLSQGKIDDRGQGGSLTRETVKGLTDAGQDLSISAILAPAATAVSGPAGPGVAFLAAKSLRNAFRPQTAEQAREGKARSYEVGGVPLGFSAEQSWNGFYDAYAGALTGEVLKFVPGDLRQSAMMALPGLIKGIREGNTHSAVKITGNPNVDEFLFNLALSYATTKIAHGLHADEAARPEKVVTEDYQPNKSQGERAKDLILRREAAQGRSVGLFRDTEGNLNPVRLSPEEVQLYKKVPQQTISRAEFDNYGLSDAHGDLQQNSFFNRGKAVNPAGVLAYEGNRPEEDLDPNNEIAVAAEFTARRINELKSQGMSNSDIAKQMQLPSELEAIQQQSAQALLNMRAQQASEVRPDDNERIVPINEELPEIQKPGHPTVDRPTITEQNLSAPVDELPPPPPPPVSKRELATGEYENEVKPIEVQHTSPQERAIRKKSERIDNLLHMIKEGEETQDTESYSHQKDLMLNDIEKMIDNGRDNNFIRNYLKVYHPEIVRGYYPENNESRDLPSSEAYQDHISNLIEAYHQTEDPNQKYEIFTEMQRIATEHDTNYSGDERYYEYGDRDLLPSGVFKPKSISLLDQVDSSILGRDISKSKFDVMEKMNERPVVQPTIAIDPARLNPRSATVKVARPNAISDGQSIGQSDQLPPPEIPGAQGPESSAGSAGSESDLIDDVPAAAALKDYTKQRQEAWQQAIDNQLNRPKPSLRQMDEKLGIVQDPSYVYPDEEATQPEHFELPPPDRTGQHDLPPSGEVPNELPPTPNIPTSEKKLTSPPENIPTPSNPVQEIASKIGVPEEDIRKAFQEDEEFPSSALRPEAKNVATNMTQDEFLSTAKELNPETAGQHEQQHRDLIRNRQMDHFDDPDDTPPVPDRVLDAPLSKPIKVFDFTKPDTENGKTYTERDANTYRDYIDTEIAKLTIQSPSIQTPNSGTKESTPVGKEGIEPIPLAERKVLKAKNYNKDIKVTTFSDHEDGGEDPALQQHQAVITLPDGTKLLGPEVSGLSEPRHAVAAAIEQYGAQQLAKIELENVSNPSEQATAKSQIVQDLYNLSKPKGRVEVVAQDENGNKISIRPVIEKDGTLVYKAFAKDGPHWVEASDTLGRTYEGAAENLADIYQDAPGTKVLDPVLNPEAAKDRKARFAGQKALEPEGSQASPGTQLPTELKLQENGLPEGVPEGSKRVIVKYGGKEYEGYEPPSKLVTKLAAPFIQLNPNQPFRQISNIPRTDIRAGESAGALPAPAGGKILPKELPGSTFAAIMGGGSGSTSGLTVNLNGIVQRMAARLGYVPGGNVAPPTPNANPVRQAKLTNLLHTAMTSFTNRMKGFYQSIKSLKQAGGNNVLTLALGRPEEIMKIGLRSLGYSDDSSDRVIQSHTKMMNNKNAGMTNADNEVKQMINDLRKKFKADDIPKISRMLWDGAQAIKGFNGDTPVFNEKGITWEVLEPKAGQTATQALTERIAAHPENYTEPNGYILQPTDFTPEPLKDGRIRFYRKFKGNPQDFDYEAKDTYAKTVTLDPTMTYENLLNNPSLAHPEIMKVLQEIDKVRSEAAKEAGIDPIDGYIHHYSEEKNLLRITRQNRLKEQIAGPRKVREGTLYRNDILDIPNASKVTKDAFGALTKMKHELVRERANNQHVAEVMDILGRPMERGEPAPKGFVQLDTEKSDFGRRLNRLPEPFLRKMGLDDEAIENLRKVGYIHQANGIMFPELVATMLHYQVREPDNAPTLRDQSPFLDHTAAFINDLTNLRSLSQLMIPKSGIADIATSLFFMHPYKIGEDIIKGGLRQARNWTGGEQDAAPFADARKDVKEYGSALVRGGKGVVRGVGNLIAEVPGMHRLGIEKQGSSLPSYLQTGKYLPDTVYHVPNQAQGPLGRLLLPTAEKMNIVKDFFDQTGKRMAFNAHVEAAADRYIASMKQSGVITNFNQAREDFLNSPPDDLIASARRAANEYSFGGDHFNPYLDDFSNHVFTKNLLSYYPKFFFKLNSFLNQRMNPLNARNRYAASLETNPAKVNFDKNELYSDDEIHRLSLHAGKKYEDEQMATVGHITLTQRQNYEDQIRTQLKADRIKQEQVRREAIAKYNRSEKDATIARLVTGGATWALTALATSFGLSVIGHKDEKDREPQKFNQETSVTIPSGDPKKTRYATVNQLSPVPEAVGSVQGFQSLFHSLANSTGFTNYDTTKDIGLADWLRSRGIGTPLYDAANKAFFDKDSGFTRTNLNKFAGEVIKSYIPYQPLLNIAAQVFDPLDREAKGFRDTLQKTTPLVRNLGAGSVQALRPNLDPETSLPIPSTGNSILPQVLGRVKGTLAKAFIPGDVREYNNVEKDVFGEEGAAALRSSKDEVKALQYHYDMPPLSPELEAELQDDLSYTYKQEQGTRFASIAKIHHENLPGAERSRGDLPAFESVYDNLLPKNQQRVRSEVAGLGIDKKAIQDKVVREFASKHGIHIRQDIPAYQPPNEAVTNVNSTIDAANISIQDQLEQSPSIASLPPEAREKALRLILGRGYVPKVPQPPQR